MTLAQTRGRKSGAAVGLSALVLALLAGAPAAAGPRAVHHDLEVRLDPAARTFSAVDVISFTGGGEIALHLGPLFTVDRLALDGREMRPVFSEGTWKFTPPEAGGHTLVVHYRATLPGRPDAGPGGIAPRPFSAPEGTLLPADSGWVPMLAGADFTYRLSVDLPEGQRAVAPGRIEDEGPSRGRVRAAFTVERPAGEILLVAGPYRVKERFAGAVRVRTYFHPELADLEETYLDKSAEYLGLYEAWIGDYPYSAFSIVSAPLPVGFGFPYLTYMGTRVLRLPFIPETSLGHEILHSWWGNGVEPDYDTGNWAEALTTFMADYTYAEREGGEAAHDMRLGWLRDFAALPPSRRRPLRDFTVRHHGAAQAVGYGKGAMVFLMLRDEIGEDAFDAGLRFFWAQHRFGTAGWDDLAAAFEHACTCRLGWFFDQWLTRADAPRLRLGEVAPVARGPEKPLFFEVAQDAPAYRLSLPVMVETREGKTRKRVRLDGLEAEYRLDIPPHPVALALDPDHRLFRRLLPGETPPILRQVMLAAETALVVAVSGAPAEEAALELASRLVEGDVNRLESAAEAPPGKALLVIGTGAALDAALEAGGLGSAPDEIAGRGTARVWAGFAPGGAPLAVVAAGDAGALRALTRRLPHYGGQSYLVFDGARVADKGLRPAHGATLRVEIP